MKKISLIMVGLFLSGFAVAKSTEPKAHDVSHAVTLAGLQPGEGDSIYSMEYFLSQSQESFHIEHLTRFSVCQDETMANCHEFAVDKYHAFKNIEGLLQNDSEIATVAISPVQSAYQSYEPSADMDEMVKQAIYLSDRRFAQIG